MTTETKKKSETRQRQDIVKLRVTDDELAVIQARAKKAGLTVAGYLRAGIFGKNTEQPRASRRPMVDVEEVTRLRHELRKIGGNLNQIAHALNQGKPFDAPAFAAVYAEYRTILASIMRALGKERRD